MLMNHGNAQTNTANDKTIEQLMNEYHSLFLTSKQLIKSFSIQQANNENLIFDNFLNDEAINTFVNTKDVIDADEISNSNIGLKWISDYTHNFGLGNSEEDDIFFKSRFATGLDWVIFGEGSFFKNKNDLKLRQAERKKDSLQNMLFSKNSIADRKFEVIKFVFDKHRLELLKNYAFFLKSKEKYTHNLFDAKLIPYSDKLKASHDYEKILNLIALNENYLSNHLNDVLFERYKNLGVSTLKLKKLDSVDFSLGIDSEIHKIQRELLIKDRKNSDRVSFRTKLRYNFYNSDGRTERSYASLGASLSVPIRFGKDDDITYKLSKIDEHFDAKTDDIKKKLLKIQYEFDVYQNKLKSLENDVQYIQALLENENEIYTKHTNKFSPEKFINYTSDLFIKKSEILDVNQKLVEYYLSYHLLLEDYLPKNNTSTFKIGTYLWSESFKSIPNDVLIEGLLKNNIQLLFLSPGSSTNLKLKDFLFLANKNKIDVHRLIGENSYAENVEDLTRLSQKITSAKVDGFTGIHLDIEPQTFDDYKSRTAYYANNMNLIYNQAYKVSLDNKLQLSISVPMHLPEQNALELAKLRIPTYIMAYDNVRQGPLLKKTTRLRTILANHYVWVLRLIDFKEATFFKEAINELKNNNVDRIGFYELSELLKQDK